MKKISHLVILLLILGMGIFLTVKSTSALSTPSRLIGKILLQVESKGEAWYVSPADGKRHSMGRPNDAFDLMRKQGIGISNDNLKKIQIANENLTGQDSDNDGLSDMAEDAIGTDKNNMDSDGDGFNDKDEIMSGYNPNGSGKLSLDNNFAKQQAGKIFLQVESKGEAWYVNPGDYKRYFLGRPTDAFNLMRKFGLGISNNDLNKISENQITYIDLWLIYNKSVEAVKNKDVTAYNQVSYKQVKSDEQAQFIQAAAFLEAMGMDVDKNEYVNKLQDTKQAIYFTNSQKADDATSYGYTRGLIMFINDKGNWKVLMANLSSGWRHTKINTNLTAAQIEEELQNMMLDSDKDGLTNMEETCSGAHQYDPKCVKTDPNKRDSNGNGWWDGIEAEMK